MEAIGKVLRWRQALRLILVNTEVMHSLGCVRGDIYLLPEVK